MRDLKSHLPSYLQKAIDDYHYVSKDLYVLMPAYIACRQFFQPAAVPVLVFAISSISTKLVIKHVSTYSNGGLSVLKKCIRPLSGRLLLVRTITAVATVILYQVVSKGNVVMTISGIFFGLVQPTKDPIRKSFVTPRKTPFNCRKNNLAVENN